MKRKLYMKSGKATYLADDRFIYAQVGDDTIRLDMFADHYYKLRLYNDVPILEVDGLRMQLVKDFDSPLDYAKEVVKGLRIPSRGGFSVLDTCMGLGYTAMEAAKRRSVSSIVTCELSEAVINLAQWNPLGGPLFKDRRIVIMKGSIADLVKDFESSTFSFVIHDPPRFSQASELYSLRFYKELHRVCKRGARIFHYVGSVGKKKGRSIEKEVEKRLKQAGFREIVYSGRLQGIFAFK